MERQVSRRWLNGELWQRRTVKGLIALVVIGVLFQSFMVVGASPIASNETISFRAGEAFTDDADVIVTSKGIHKISSTIAASGNTEPGVETSTTLSAVNNALIRNHFAYRFQVKELAAGSWRGGEKLEIEVYGDDGSSTSLLATLYVQQSKADHTNIEGVAATIDMGSSNSIPDRFDVIVTRR